MLASNERKEFLHLILLLNVENSLSVCSLQMLFPVLNSSHLCALVAPSIKSGWWKRCFLISLKDFKIISKGVCIASSLQENLGHKLYEGSLVKHFNSNASG